MIQTSQRTYGESATHRCLKEQTFLWAFERGYRCCAMEVRAPRSRFIVDLAGIRFDRMDGVPTVAVFECKQSREDLERNNRRESELKAKLLTLQERRETLERLLAIHYPSLRMADSLFPEWSTFDFSTIDHVSYRRTVQKISRIQRQLFDNTKFDQMSRYKLGNLQYLVTTPGLLSPREVPLGWGLLEADGTAEICQKLAPTRCSRVEILEWLKLIAKAATRQSMKPLLAQNDKTSTEQSQTSEGEMDPLITLDPPAQAA
jgi:hypothetical protein